MTTKHFPKDQHDSQFHPVHIFTIYLSMINVILTKVNVRLTEFRDLTTCSLLDRHQHFKEACCLHLECKLLEYSIKTFVPVNRTTYCDSPENSSLKIAMKHNLCCAAVYKYSTTGKGRET
jgi:hypothetical protein